MSELNGIEDDDDSFFFEVEKILDMEMTPNGRMFFIKWKNYPDSCENSWEPEHNLNCHEIKEEFLRQAEQKKDLKDIKQKKRAAKKKKKQDGVPQEEVENTPSSSTSTNSAIPTAAPGTSSSVNANLSESNTSTEKTIPQKRKKHKKSKLNQTTSAAVEGSTKDARKKKKPTTEQSSNNSISADKQKGRESSTSRPAVSSSLANHVVNKPAPSLKITKNPIDSPQKLPLPKNALHWALARMKSASSTSSSPVVSVTGAQTPNKNTSLQRKPEVIAATPQVNSISIPNTTSITAPKITALAIQKSSSNPIQKSTAANNSLITPQPIQKSASNPIQKITAVPQVNAQLTPSSPSSPIIQKGTPQPIQKVTPQPLSKTLLKLTPNTTTKPLTSQPSPTSSSHPALKVSLKLTPNSTTKPVPSHPSPVSPSYSNLKAGLKPTSKPTHKTPNHPTAFNIDSYLEKMTSHSQPTTQYPAARSSANAHSNTPFAHQTPHIRSHETAVHPPRQSHAPTATFPMKRTANSPDSRIPSPALKRSRNEEAVLVPFTPLIMPAVMTSSKSRIAPIRIETTRACTHIPDFEKFIDLYGVQERQKVVKVDWYVPTSRLQQIVNPGERKDILIIKATENMVDLSKFRNFMQVNEVAAIASHPMSPTESLAVLPYSEIRKLGYDIQVDGAYLYIIYLRDLPTRPFFKLSGRMDATIHSWDAVTEYLKFPRQLLACKDSAQFVIYGHSESSEMLRKATADLQPTKPVNPGRFQPAHIMMFDRQNDTVFNKRLTRHKKMPGTQMWEYGVPDLSYSEIVAVQQVFPFGSGGLVITDMKNMIANPSIIETIIEQIKKIDPNKHGEWQFILPDNFMSEMKKAITSISTAENAQKVLIKLSIALAKDELQVASLWMLNEKEYEWIDFAHALVRQSYRDRQYFVYVDDVGSISDEIREKHKSIDFVKSLEVYNTFIA